MFSPFPYTIIRLLCVFVNKKKRKNYTILYAYFVRIIHIFILLALYGTWCLPAMDFNSHTHTRREKIPAMGAGTKFYPLPFLLFIWVYCHCLAVISTHTLSGYSLKVRLLVHFFIFHIFKNVPGLTI